MVMSMNPLQQACLALSVLIAFCIGGIVVTYTRHPVPPMHIKEDAAGSGVVMVTIDGIRNSA
jgi:hypothetical protein